MKKFLKNREIEERMILEWMIVRTCPCLSVCQSGPSDGNDDNPWATLSLFCTREQASYNVRPREKMSAGGYLSLESKSSGAIYLNKKERREIWNVEIIIIRWNHTWKNVNIFRKKRLKCIIMKQNILLDKNWIFYIKNDFLLY